MRAVLDLPRPAPDPLDEVLGGGEGGVGQPAAPQQQRPDALDEVDEQVAVVGPGEALAFVAPAVVAARPVGQPGALTRLVAPMRAGRCLRHTPGPARRSRSDAESGRGPGSSGCDPGGPRCGQPASSTSRTRPRRRSMSRAPPRCFHLRPGLLHPAGDLLLIALDGPTDRYLTGRAVPDEQLAHPCRV